MGVVVTFVNERWWCRFAVAMVDSKVLFPACAAAAGWCSLHLLVDGDGVAMMVERS